MNRAKKTGKEWGQQISLRTLGFVVPVVCAVLFLCLFLGKYFGWQNDLEAARRAQSAPLTPPEQNIKPLQKPPDPDNVMYPLLFGQPSKPKTFDEKTVWEPVSELIVQAYDAFRESGNFVAALRAALRMPADKMPDDTLFSVIDLIYEGDMKREYEAETAHYRACGHPNAVFTLNSLPYPANLIFLQNLRIRLMDQASVPAKIANIMLLKLMQSNRSMLLSKLLNDLLKKEAPGQIIEYNKVAYESAMDEILTEMPRFPLRLVRTVFSQLKNQSLSLPDRAERQWFASTGGSAKQRAFLEEVFQRKSQDLDVNEWRQFPSAIRQMILRGFFAALAPEIQPSFLQKCADSTVDAVREWLAIWKRPVAADEFLITFLCKNPRHLAALDKRDYTGALTAQQTTWKELSGVALPDELQQYFANCLSCEKALVQTICMPQKLEKTATFGLTSELFLRKVNECRRADIARRDPKGYLRAVLRAYVQQNRGESPDMRGLRDFPPPDKILKLLRKNDER